jgi:hypothetical protein
MKTWMAAASLLFQGGRCNPSLRDWQHISGWHSLRNYNRDRTGIYTIAGNISEADSIMVLDKTEAVYMGWTRLQVM